MSQGRIIAGGTGTVSIQGLGGKGTSNGNMGVTLESSSLVSSGGRDIQVESEVNVGTTFTVVLPVLEKEVGPEEMKQENGRSRSSLRLLTSSRRKEKQGD